MIKKERFEKLAKKEAVIYKIEKEIFIAGYSNTLKIVPIKLDKDFLNIKMYDVLNDLFETKEDAEEYLEFDTTQKTETLLMCDWDVAKDKKCGYCADFWVDGSNYSMLISADTIYIQEEYYSNEKWNKDILFKESLNRENYDKARRLCKKLFSGEEV